MLMLGITILLYVSVLIQVTLIVLAGNLHYKGCRESS
jgi:hypothetical protein